MIEPTALPFGKKKTIRAVTIEEAIWFVASDIFKAFKLETCRAFLSTFRDEDLRLETISTDAGPKRHTLVSVLGALTIGTMLRDDAPVILDSWVRREVRNLATQASISIDVPMTLASNGGLLVRPRPKAPHYQAWLEFCDTLPVKGQSFPRPNLPVLLDDDENAESDEKQAFNAEHIATWIKKRFPSLSA